MKVQVWGVMLSVLLLLLAPALVEAQRGGGGKGGGGGGRGGGGGGQARSGGGGQARSGGGSQRGGSSRSFQGGGGRSSFQGGSSRSSAGRSSSMQRPSSRPSVASPSGRSSQRPSVQRSAPRQPSRPSVASPSRAPQRPSVQRSAPRTTSRDYAARSGNISRDAQRSAQNRPQAGRQSAVDLMRNRDTGGNFVRDYTGSRSDGRTGTRPQFDQNRSRYTTGSRGGRDDVGRSAQNRIQSGRPSTADATRNRYTGGNFVRDYTGSRADGRPGTRPQFDQNRSRYTASYRGDRDDFGRNTQNWNRTGDWNRDRGGDWNRNRYSDGNRNRYGDWNGNRYDGNRNRYSDWIGNDRYRDGYRNNWDRGRYGGGYQFARRYDHNYWGNRSFFLGVGSPFGRYLGYPWWFGGVGSRFAFYPGYGYNYGFGDYGAPGYYTYQSNYAYAPGGYYDDTGYITSAVAVEPIAAPSEEKLEAALDYAAQGEVAFRERRYEEAVQLWRHALVDDPTNGAIVLLLSQALFQTGEWEDAAGSIQQAARMLPEERWGTVLEHYTELYGYPEDYRTQFKQLQEAGLADANSPALHFLLGYHLGFVGFPAQAVGELDVVLANSRGDEVAKRLREMFAAKLPANPPPQGATF